MKKALFKREDARRLARTFVNSRTKQGESIPGNSIRRMQALPANVLLQFASRPPSVRKSVVLGSVTPHVVTLRFSCDAR